MTRTLDKTTSEFYVYVLMDTRKVGPFKYGHWKFDYEPFYVGKGKQNRFLYHSKILDGWKLDASNNRHKTNKIKKIHREGYEIETRFVKSGMIESDAFDLEMKLIERIGRSPEGPLTNQTAGGDGLRAPSKATRKKMASSAKNTHASMSKKKRAEMLRKRSESLKRYHANKSPEATAKMIANMLATKEAYSEKERKEISQRRSAGLKKTFAKRTPEKRAEIAAKISVTKRSISAEQKQLISSKISKAVKQRWKEGAYD